MGCSASTMGKRNFATTRENIVEDVVSTVPAMNASRRLESQQHVELIELTETMVEDYVRMDKEISRLEKKNVSHKYEEKSWYAIELKKNMDRLDAIYKELKKQTDKTKACVESIEQAPVRDFLKKQGTYEQKLKREQKEYLESLNRQDAAHQEYQRVAAEYEKAEKIAVYYKDKYQTLNELYDRQDQLIAGVFAGTYGSKVAYRLEMQLDEALAWQQRIALAKFKWINGRVLLVHASVQISFGIKRWRDLDNIELSNHRMRYFAAAEARNNFIAAGQNVRSCRVYLGKVEFPYCRKELMDEMDKAAAHALSNFQSKDRCKKALSVYDRAHKEIAALVHWFDQVLKETIFPELQQANREVCGTQQELRIERFRLLREKARSILGHYIESDSVESQENSDDDEQCRLEMQMDNTPFDSAKLSVPSSCHQLHLSPSSNSLSPVALARVPSTETLFGSITELKRQHEIERRELERQQELARAKMDQGLRDKLLQRRIRRELLKLECGDELSPIVYQ